MWLTRLCLVFVIGFCGPFQVQVKSDSFDKPQPPSLTTIIHKYADQRDIDPLLVAAILKVESNFGEVTKSPSGKDHGPMQINEWWFPKLGINKHDVSSMEGGIKWGTKILAMNRDEHRGEGCWWSLYNSHNPRARKRYEVKIKNVFARLDLKPDCSGVKTANL